MSSSASSATGKLPSHAEVLLLPPNRIRELLNAQAADLLGDSPSPKQYQVFAEFCKNYGQAIHTASYLSVQDEGTGSNEILGYEIVRKIDKDGAFGKVWQAVADDGSLAAVKMFRHEVREKPNLLEMFRRGVRSHKILSASSIKGVVKLFKASEIPPVEIMEWIEGEDLSDVINKRLIAGWGAKLRIAVDLSRIIHNAHNLPESVFHRDIRPQNVRLRDFWSDRDDSEVVVLDFDLSWHVGALEQSFHTNNSPNYMSPEQQFAVDGTSTRNASVDSYGLGMTLFKLFTEDEPRPLIHRDPTWSQQVTAGLRKAGKVRRRSLIGRMSRLILACTRENQHQRPSMGQILQELERLRLLEIEDSPSWTNRDWAEELVAGSEYLSSYNTINGDSTFSSALNSGLKVVFDTQTTPSVCGAMFEYQQTGMEKYANFHQIGDTFKQIGPRLSQFGWSFSNTEFVSAGFFRVVGTFDMSQAVRFPIEAQHKVLDAVIDKIVAVANR